MLNRINKVIPKNTRCFLFAHPKTYSSLPKTVSIAEYYKSNLTPKLEAKISEIFNKNALINQKLLKVEEMTSNEFSSLSKELAGTKVISEIYSSIISGKNVCFFLELKDLIELYNSESLELRDLILNDLTCTAKTLIESEEKLFEALVPKDKIDQNDVILEIRAGTGGDEASLFASELVKMYERLCVSNHYKMSTISTSKENEMIKEYIAEISGRGAYGKMRFESGVHRVQRVPTTDSSGRIHTSTVTVAVMPQASSVEITINPSDLRIDSFKASGKGGQHVNTTDSAVRITHIPTGLVVANQEERSQLKNKEKAMKVLYAKLYDLEYNRILSARRNTRNTMIGSGSRSEKIRTYNFPQNRVTDHRINKSILNVPGVLIGTRLNEMIDALRIDYNLSELAKFTE
ncbi:hypothetical protein BB561_002982 [Smittium simulii]|uniref:Peptide chain release factor domain-containing protein n=1 Tax=Smittium simulii TaxID=133385 RepID=A0A2T9YNH4_9FUNG|nr:hypothetical protein BB561_002982 [Smittium simulii]